MNVCVSFPATRAVGARALRCSPPGRRPTCSRGCGRLASLRHRCTARTPGFVVDVPVDFDRVRHARDFVRSVCITKFSVEIAGLFGSGNTFMRARPSGVIRFCGMMLSGMRTGLPEPGCRARRSSGECRRGLPSAKNRRAVQLGRDASRHQRARQRLLELLDVVEEEQLVAANRAAEVSADVVEPVFRLRLAVRSCLPMNPRSAPRSARSRKTRRAPGWCPTW